MQKRPPLLRVLQDLFPGRERTLMFGVFAVSLTAAFFETIGVASILPFMGFVLDPASIEKYPIIGQITGAFGVETPRGQLMMMGALTAATVGLGNLAGGLNVFVQERFTARTSGRLQSSLFAAYMAQPYAFHVDRDAPSLMKIVLNDVRIVIREVLTPFLVAVSRSLIVVGILTLLFLQNPSVALVVSGVCVVSYMAVFLSVRGRQQRQGELFDRSNLERHRVAQEGLGGVKELQVLGRTQPVTEQFHHAAYLAATSESSNRTTAQMPKYILETIAFGGILLVTLGMVARSAAGAQAAVPVLALYAFAGYRLMPSLQAMFYAVVSIRFNYPVLLGLHTDMEIARQRRVRVAAEGPVKPITFENELVLEDITFTYPTASSPALSNINLRIRPNESIGFVGRTGSGKTTLADIILGVYAPGSGKLSVDGVPLAGSAVRSWQQRVGYVPQQVFLTDASIAENIAFGVTPSEIDREAVGAAARLAQAEEFIRELPQGFATVVGERGVKLSGGQRQRIGIARALYHRPDVLVFDEATSALDGLTEDAVMEAIRALSGERTVILIAHRLRTVEACDRIVMLDKGVVVADGSYRSLLERSMHFQRFVGRHARRSGEFGGVVA